MSVTVDDFRARFPEFSDDTLYSDTRIQMFIDEAAMCIDQNRYGTFYNAANCYLAAHLLYLGSVTSNGGAGNVGPVASKTAGGVSVTRAVNSMDLSESDAFYTQTQYGLSFINIRNKVKIPGFFVASGGQTWP